MFRRLFQFGIPMLFASFLAHAHAEEAGGEWFETCAEAERSVILRELGFIVNQAHPLVVEVPPAIEESGLKAPSRRVCLR